jgi:epoxide hydrolase 4
MAHADGNRAEQSSRSAQLPTGVRLHYLEAGAGAGRPLVVLLHGFPECAIAWRHQIGPLAAAGLHVVAPDLRGYRRSDKPRRVGDYRIDRLVDDVAELSRHAGHDAAAIVGHDWGGIIAWHVAMRRPELVSRLVILNAPHPAVFRRELWRTSQWARSWYAAFFQLPWLPEAVIRANHLAVLRRLFRTDPARADAYDDADIDAYVAALSAPGALSAAIHYYRAGVRFRGPMSVLSAPARVDAPTLLIWGMRDRFLVPQLADGLEPFVRDLRVERLAAASHWVHRDEPERVTSLIRDFVLPE